MISIVRKAHRLMFAAVAVSVLGACATEPAPQFPELTFAHLPAINLGVAEIQVENAFRPDTANTHIEARMPVSPEIALRAWARDRLRATGVSGVAKFIIEDASVTEVPLARTTGLKGTFTKDQSHRYDAKIRATLRLEGVPRVSQAYADVQISRSQTVREDISVNERNQVWFDLTEQVMKDFNPAMTSSVRQHLGDFTR